MRKLGWYAVSAVVVAFILVSVLLLAANLYVQSQGVQQRIHEALDAHLKTPVTLKKTTVTPWDGLRLDGIILHGEKPDAEPPGHGGRASDFLTVASFRVRFAWWPLIVERRLVVDQVLLDKPRLVWQQDAEGRWTFPLGDETAHRNKKEGRPSKGDAVPSATPEAVPAEPTTEPAVVTADKTPPATSIMPAPPAETHPPKNRQDLPIAVDKFRLRHGTFDFLNHQRRPLCRVEEVNLDAQLSNSRRAAGSLSIEKASLPRVGLALTKFHSAFSYDEERGLSLHDGQGLLAGGELRTDYRLRTGEAGSPFAASCRVENVDLGQLVHATNGQPSLLEGQLHGNTEFRGMSDNPDTHQGAGRLWLVEAKLRDFPLLKVLGQALRISDLSHLQFKQAEVNYRLEGTVLRIDPLVMASNDLQIVAHGQYLTDTDQLDLHARLVIDQAVSHQLPQFIESNFTPSGDESPGSRYIDFDVTGRLDDPKSNLYDRMMAGPMKGLLDNLLAPPKPKAPKDKSRNRDGKSRPSPSAVPET